MSLKSLLLTPRDKIGELCGMLIVGLQQVCGCCGGGDAHDVKKNQFVKH